MSNFLYNLEWWKFTNLRPRLFPFQCCMVCSLLSCCDLNAEFFYLLFILLFYYFFTLFGMVSGQVVHHYLLKGFCERNIYSFPYHKWMVLVFVDNLKLYLKKKNITETCCNLGSILQLPKYQMNTIKQLFLFFCLLWIMNLNVVSLLAFS